MHCLAFHGVPLINLLVAWSQDGEHEQTGAQELCKGKFACTRFIAQDSHGHQTVPNFCLFGYLVKGLNLASIGSTVGSQLCLPTSGH